MSVFGGGVYAKELTDRLGIGVTISASGALLSVTGPTIQYVTADPNGVETARAGSLALQNNATVWINTNGVTAWQQIGGAGGASLPDDVPFTWGTTSPLQGTITYVSGSVLFLITSKAVSQATAQVSADVTVTSGSSTITGAAVGSASGAVIFSSGGTNSTNAGGTGGSTGAVKLGSGDALSTLGVSGNSGNTLVVSGNSDDGNSGDVILRPGTAGALRGAIFFDSSVLSSITQAQTWNILDNSASALVITTGGLSSMLTFSTLNGNESVASAVRLTTTDGVASGTVRVVGGRAFSSTADSSQLAQAAAGYVAFDTTYSVPASTFKSGSVCRITATVRITTVLNGGATAQAQLQIGGADFGTSAESTAGASGTRCRIVAEFTTRAAPGAAVATSGMASLQWSDTPGTVTLFPGAAVAVPNLATNGALVIGVAVESSAAGDGSGRMVLEQLDVEIL